MINASIADRLRRTIAGGVAVPGSADYDRLRRPAIARFAAARPLAVVTCRDAADAAAAVTFARQQGVPLVPRSGGHCFAGRSSGPGIVLDVSALQTISVDGDRAVVGAGVRLGALVPALQEAGVAVPTGCGPGVGIAGLTLGGGLGVLGRTFGLTADRLLAAQVVLADGSVVDCDDHRDADLFWALRGAGGGQFGVVTALTYATVPVPPRLTAFHHAWSAEHLAALIGAWQRWSPDGPDALAASLLIIVPADPARPPTLNVFGTLIGSESAAVDLLGDLAGVVGAAPRSTRATELSYAAAKEFLVRVGVEVAGEPTGPVHQPSRSEFVDRVLPDEVIMELARILVEDRRPGQARELDLTPWGGAYARTPVAATAFAHRQARFLLKHTATIAPEPVAEAEARCWLDRSWETVHRWGTGGVYPNFPDPGLTDPERAYHGTNLDRLRRVKARYDPDRFFRFPQSITASS
ncbi:FAD-binding oxidoreductase [Microlunatus speluncae]|uniref:FAD-binding oxidoreductase n=1 Tax=Microlunatus speluncae TaxID=2594267 RepID=UPI0012667FE5|nr:FAD-binding oxidoreductase [Microlunatus speluncae]